MIGSLKIDTSAETVERRAARIASWHPSDSHALSDAALLRTLLAERETLRKAATAVAASLAAAISLLERGGKAAKKAAPSDKMFDQMLVDYRRSLDRARTALRGLGNEPSTGNRT